MDAIARFHQRVQCPTYQQGALHRILGLASEEHLLDIEAHVDKVRMRIAMQEDLHSLHHAATSTGVTPAAQMPV